MCYFDTMMYEENQEKLENLREIIQNLLFFEVVEEPLNQIRVKLSDNERPALEFIVKNNSQISEKIANISSSQLLEHALNFFLPFAKFLLFRIRDMKMNANSDHKFVSASLMLGMWQKIQATSEFDDFLGMKMYEAHMANNRQNFFNLLKRETIENLIPDLFIVCGNAGQTAAGDGGEEMSQAQFYFDLMNMLRELSFVIPSILARLEQFAPAIVFNNAARELFNFEEDTWTHGVLNLLHASGIVHMAKLDCNFDNMELFHEYRQNAYRIFSRIPDTEGQADAYFLWAIMLLFEKENDQKRGDDFTIHLVNDSARTNAGSLASASDFYKNSGLDGDELNMDRIFLNGKPNAMDCLDEALYLFRQAETE